MSEVPLWRKGLLGGRTGTASLSTSTRLSTWEKWVDPSEAELVPPFEPSLDALSLRPDVISSIKIFSLVLANGMVGTMGTRFVGRAELHNQLVNLRKVGRSLLGPVVPSFRTLSRRLKLTVRRHKFNTDSLSGGGSSRRSRMPTRQRTTTLSSKVNLPHPINFRALCGANSVTEPSNF